MATTYLSRTPSTGVNRRTFTYSGWIKRATINSYDIIFEASNGSHTFQIATNPTGDGDCIKFYDYNGASNLEIKTNQAFRDLSAWYHIVIAIDTTQATSTNRAKLYVNGEQVTSLATSTYPTQNYDTGLNNSVPMQIGRQQSTSYYFNGSMSHIHFIDGTAYDASAFGEVDSATGQWKIKTSPTIADYGTNGFFILEDGNSVTDQSGKGNNFTVGGGTLTKTEDNPSNVFATLNPLDASSSGTFSNGNNTYGVGSATWCPTKSTLAFSNGKYYCEAKGVSGTNLYVGVYDVDVARGSVQSEMDNNRIVYVYNGSIQRTLTGNSEVTGLATYTTSDIIGCAVDKENGTVKFYKNGTLIHTETDSSVTNKTLCFGTQVNNSTLTYNFGNGYFGTTAVASAGTNASGNGIFEYDVPTGYTALSTKGLNL